MGQGTALVDFNDFVRATKPHKITPTTEILNDTARNYYLLGDMLKGRQTEEIVQNGKEIIDLVRLAKHNAASFYKPNADLQPQGMDVLTQLTCPWRFHQGNYAWTKEQVELNGGSAMDNWVRLVTAWREACDQDIWDSLEAALMADPAADMEADDGTTPYSILSFVTEDGLAPSAFTTGTVMGVNVSQQENWRNQTGTYAKDDIETADSLYKAFDEMWSDLNWSGPSSSQEWFQSTDFRKLKILTDKNGRLQYLQTNRNSNDRLVRANDAGAGYTDPHYSGIPVKRVNTLDEKQWATPHYLWIDTRFLFPVFHSNVYMEEGDPMPGGPTRPFSMVVYKNTYLNLFCRSRKRQGFIKGTAS